MRRFVLHASVPYAANPLHGLPRALYVDRHSIYPADGEPTPQQFLAGIEPQTQFGRATSALDVELILAHSLQAKGPVERHRVWHRHIRRVRLGRWRALPSLVVGNR